METSEKGQKGRRSDRQRNDDPTGEHDLTITHLQAHIPKEMSDAIEGMKRERKSETEFDQDFGEEGPSAESGGKAETTEMPT